MVIHGQSDGELCPVSYLALHIYGPTVSFDNLPNGRQSEAGST